MKRCSPGTRRNKKTGICDEYVPKNKTLKASVTKEKKMNAAMVKAMAKKIAAQYNYPEGTLSDYSAKQLSALFAKTFKTKSLDDINATWKEGGGRADHFNTKEEAILYYLTDVLTSSINGARDQEKNDRDSYRDGFRKDRQGNWYEAFPPGSKENKVGYKRKNVLNYSYIVGVMKLDYHFEAMFF